MWEKNEGRQHYEVINIDWSEDWMLLYGAGHWNRPCTGLYVGKE